MWHPTGKLRSVKHDKQKTITDNKRTKDVTEQKCHPPVGLSHLEEDEQKVVKDILYGGSDDLARMDSDTGCISGWQLKIHLKDKTPLQTPYSAISKCLYRELKDYVQNFVGSWLYQEVQLTLLVSCGLPQEKRQELTIAIAVARPLFELIEAPSTSSQRPRSGQLEL